MVMFQSAAGCNAKGKLRHNILGAGQLPGPATLHKDKLALRKGGKDRAAPQLEHGPGHKVLGAPHRWRSFRRTGMLQWTARLCNRVLKLQEKPLWSLPSAPGLPGQKATVQTLPLTFRNFNQDPLGCTGAKIGMLHCFFMQLAQQQLRTNSRLGED